MANENEKIWLVCPNPNCKEGFVHFIDESGKKLLGIVGAAAGGTVGAKAGVLGGVLSGALVGAKGGLLGGPIGLVAGVIVGSVVGLGAGKKFGEKFDKPRCPKCGVKFDIREGFPKE